MSHVSKFKKKTKKKKRKKERKKMIKRKKKEVKRKKEGEGEMEESKQRERERKEKKKVFCLFLRFMEIKSSFSSKRERKLIHASQATRGYQNLRVLSNSMR